VCAVHAVCASPSACQHCFVPAPSPRPRAESRRKSPSPLPVLPAPQAARR
jgi:hypothetical protein